MADPARPLAIQLLDAGDRMAELLSGRLEQSGWPSLTRNQLLVLVHVARSETTPAELARRLDVSRQSMQKIAERLADLDVVTLIAHPTDQRSKLVTLTESGSDFGADALRILDGFERRLEAAFGFETMWTVRRIISADWSTLFETIGDQNANGR